MSRATEEDAILVAMLQQAEQLCQTRDALMVGQYRYLAERIRGLIEQRETSLAVEPPGQ